VKSKSTIKGKFSSSYGESEKAPSYILPARFVGGVDGDCGRARRAIIDALLSMSLSPWITRPRISCLLALTSHIAKASKKSASPKREGVPCSAVQARSYCSKLRTAPAGIERDALPLLVRIGILEIASPAIIGFHEKLSARYRISPAYKGVKFEATDHQTNACTYKKLSNAPARLEAGLNRRWPFRAQLLRDLSRISISECAAPEIDKLKLCGARKSTLAVIAAIATREHTVKVKGSGLIVTSLLSCPRELKPHLFIDGVPVVLCDISSAHWMFLPRLVMDRIAFRRKRGDDENSLAPLVAEYERLILFLSAGSFYLQFCRNDATEAEIKARKKLLNVLLNDKLERSKNNRLWHWVRSRFPLCVNIIADIKKTDHRNISKQLQHFTANAINAALLEIQALGLPAIPDTDCLIVRARDKEVACRIIAEKMLKETRGVWVTVGGLRFEKTSGPCESKSETWGG
jgi:hypothetical protein